MVKAWQSRPPQGTAVCLPSVLELAIGPDPGTIPQVIHIGTRRLVHYSRPRLFLDRNAWELLEQTEDVLVQRIRPEHEPPFTIALTKSELENVFGSVRQTRSWDDVRCYHFPQLPPAVDSFRVHVSTSLGAARCESGAIERKGSKERERASERTQPPPPARGNCSSNTIAGWAEEWASRAEGRAESEAYLSSVAEWRDFWRPSAIKILLVAESHVGEVSGDTNVRVSIPHSKLADLPRSYCRLVYCLGYGEDGLCTPEPARNTGTWQFWDIFGAIIGGLKQTQPRKAMSSLEERLQWKMDVLSQLRAKGVWLVDASVAGIYLPGGARSVVGHQYERMLRDSYERYVWPSVKDDPIEQIWVIGSGVRRALDGHSSMVKARTIVQPQGDRQEPGRHQRELAEMVKSIRPVIPAPT